jgi:hypothetical protein
MKNTKDTKREGLKPRSGFCRWNSLSCVGCISWCPPNRKNCHRFVSAAIPFVRGGVYAAGLS